MAPVAKLVSLAVALFGLSPLTAAAPRAPVRRSTPMSARRASSADTGGFYIVSFEDGKSYNASFLDEVSWATGAHVDLESDLTGPIFNGVTLFVSGDIGASVNLEEAIGALPGVRAVLHDEPLTLPEINVTGSVPYDGQKKSGFSAMAVQDKYPQDKIMMQVDQMRAAGLSGKGIRVAVIDSAIDDSHPAINVDFVHDYRHPDDVANPDPSCKSHATICGGLVSSLPGPDGYAVGAAPGVSLGNYIYAGCNHNGGVETVLKAMQQAVIDKTNILSVSLVWGAAWRFIEQGEIMRKVAEAGVLVVMGAGNSGDTGLFHAWESCAAPGVLCVGMTENLAKGGWGKSNTTITLGDDVRELAWRQSKIDGGWPTRTMPVWTNVAPGAGGWGGWGGDGCKDLPADVPDLSNYIVMIRRNLCNEDDMIDRVANAGAKYILIAELGDVVEDLFDPDIRREHPNVVALGTILGEMGQRIAAWVRAGDSVTVDLSKSELTLLEKMRTQDGKQVQARMHDGSQWGPTLDAGAATDVAAPGWDIPVAIAPGTQGGNLYGLASGTSMATPLVAGVAAMVMEALGTTDPVVVAAAIVGTAKPLERAAGGLPGQGLASTAHQGGGLIQGLAAAGVSAVIEEEFISFNGTDQREPQKLTIVNRSGRDISYELSDVAAKSIYSFADASVPVPPRGHDNIHKQYVDGTASLRYSQNRITVPANGRATVQVTAQEPVSLDAKRLPLWSGWIQLKASDGKDLSIPYMGISGDIDRVSKVSRLSISYGGGAITQDPVRVEVEIGMGSRSVDAFIVDANTDKLAHPEPFWKLFHPQFSGHITSWKGEIWGTQIPAGTYKVRVKALRTFGVVGSTDASDYQVVDSQPFTFRR